MNYAPAMAGSSGGRRPRGSIRRHRGNLQVRVYAGLDPVTGKDSYLTETVPAGPDAEKQAEKVRTKLLHQVDEQRAARTSASLDHAITEWPAVAELEVSTRIGYQSYISRYIRPALGKVPVRSLKVEQLDQFYASLRRCRARCSRSAHVEHQAEGTHDCAEVGCAPHVCRPLGASTVRQIHSIISAALSNAVRWG